MTESAPRRLSGAGAIDDRLFFAQVREDPLLEIAALEPRPDSTLVVVGSGGCTALSLLSAGAGRVIAVDVNRCQHHLTELKTIAVSELGPVTAAGFLGGFPLATIERLDQYRSIEKSLSTAAQAWWSSRTRSIASGVIASGVTERFIAAVMGVVRRTIHPPNRMDRFLRCQTIDEQRRLYREEWDSARWHLLFKLLLNRMVFRHTYEPGFLANLEQPSFARHFDRVAEHTLTNISVASNYFVHHMFTGAYPRGVEGGLPPYLGSAAAESGASWAERLTLVDGGYTEHLQTLPAGSVNGFALSNICEWFTPAQIEALFAEILRTAKPGATLVFRNFLGWTEVPAIHADRIIEDRIRGEAMILTDRSALQRRIAVCRVDG